MRNGAKRPNSGLVGGGADTPDAIRMSKFRSKVTTLIG